MKAYDVNDLLALQQQAQKPYLEFFRAPSMSLGIYALPAGGTDPQAPHAEDEVYYVLSGRGRFQAGAEDRAVAAGSILFVGAGEAHRFHSIEADLTLLVFFAPAETGG